MSENKSWFEEKIDKLNKDYQFMLEEIKLDFIEKVISIMGKENIDIQELRKKSGINKKDFDRIFSTHSLTLEEMCKIAIGLNKKIKINLKEIS